VIQPTVAAIFVFRILQTWWEAFRVIAERAGLVLRARLENLHICDLPFLLNIPDHTALASGVEGVFPLVRCYGSPNVFFNFALTNNHLKK